MSERIVINPWDEDATLPETQRHAFFALLSRIFEELPCNKTTWAASLALGLPRCIGLSVSDMARFAKCSEGSLIHAAVTFAANVEIKASPHLRSAVQTHMASGEIATKGTPEAGPTPGKESL